MNEIIEEFREEHPDGTYQDWVEFYYEEHSGEERLEEATERLFEMVKKMRNAMNNIDEDMVQEYIKDH